MSSPLVQDALQTSQQTRLQLEQSLQAHIAEAAHVQSASAQTVTASQAELHRLEQQAKALQQDLVAARTRMDEERSQTKQLASALATAHEEHQVRSLVYIEKPGTPANSGCT